MTGSAQRVLVVSPYPPVRDGIANYALQMVAHLRGEGHHVEVLSPWPSAAHHHLDLTGPARVQRLVPLARRFDRVVVHYHPELFPPRSPFGGDRAAMALGLARVFRALPRLELLVHEADYGLGRGDGAVAQAQRVMWRSARSIAVHTERERDDLLAAFGVAPTRVRVVRHGGNFSRRTWTDRAGARASLGLDADETLFLSIGFLQPHKGFDRAARAFAGLGDHGARLAVVGAVRVEDPEILAHVRDLERLAGRTPGVELRTGFVSDEAFDRWIVAADVVVLPYRLIWSSSVVERALLYERPVIATRVGGLAQQLADQPLATLVDDDAGLRLALWEAAGAGEITPPPPDWPAGVATDRDGVMREIRRRAAAARGTAPPVPVQGTRSGITLSAPLRRLPLLAAPSPASSRPGVSRLKRLILKATYWEIKDLIAQVNHLHKALIDVIEAAAPPDQPASTDSVSRSRSAEAAQE